MISGVYRFKCSRDRRVINGRLERGIVLAYPGVLSRVTIFVVREHPGVCVHFCKTG